MTFVVGDQYDCSVVGYSAGWAIFFARGPYKKVCALRATLFEQTMLDSYILSSNMSANQGRNKLKFGFGRDKNLRPL